ncbi:MAG: hypothetical protein IKO78_04930 [Bacilli bacterium]|nr:hypothetical protein [Bacilli bacterium]
MKKGIFSVALFLVSVLVLTGCGGNKLVCTNSTTKQAYGYDMEIKQKFSMGFSDDKLSDADAVIDVELSDGLYDALKNEGNIDDNMKALASQLETSMKAEFGSSVKSVSSSYSGKTVTIKLGLDASGSQNGSTREEVKKSFEGNGFSCN